MVNLDDPNVWVQACEQHVVLFKRIMPMAMENLVITQHQNTLQYATIYGNGYQPKVQRIELKDYVICRRQHLVY